jgi:hypothetical protein
MPPATWRRPTGVEPTDPLGWLFSHADRLTPDLQQWAELVRADLAGDDLRPVHDPMTRAMQSRMVLASLLQLASPRPWLLAVDDFDRIDDVSRAVFTQLAEGATAGPVMFVGSVGADFPCRTCSGRRRSCTWIRSIPTRRSST